MPIIRRKKTGGRPEDSLRKYLRKAYGLTRKKIELTMPWADQLARCGSDEARRLLLGTSEKMRPTVESAEVIERQLELAERVA